MTNLYWKIAFKNLLRNKRRSLATGFAIAFGFNGLILLGAYIHRVKNLLESNTVYIGHQGHIAFYKTDSLDKYYSNPSKYLFSPQEQKLVLGLLDPWKSDIEMVSPKLAGMGMASKDNKSTPFAAIGIEPQLDQFVRSHPFAQKWTPDFVRDTEESNLSSAASKDSSAISITKTMAQILNITDTAGEIQLAGKNFFGDLNAVNANATLRHSTGIELLEDISLVANLSLLKDLYSTDGVSSFAVYLKDRNLAQNISDLLQAEIKNNNLAFEVYPFTDEKVSPIYVGTLSFLYVMAVFFSVLILSAVCLSIVNSITMGILERVREIGTLRAIGYKPQMITSLFVKEAIILTALSAFSGLIFALIISQTVNSLNIKYRPPATASPIQFLLIPNLYICLLICAAFFMLTYLTAYVVTRKKTQLRIVELLTDTGA